MDARSAQVIGWEVLGVSQRFSRGVMPGGERNGMIPRYSSDPGAAFEFEEKILETEHASLYIAHLSSAVIPLEDGVYSETHLIAIAHAEPAVRCRAALKASMKIPVEKIPARPRKPAARRSATNDDVELL